MKPMSLLMLLPMALLLESCASAQQENAPAASSTAPAVSPAATTQEYLIGPGDTLQVFVWEEPELSVTVPVRPDGRVSTPLIEDLTAVGKTPTQLEQEMERILSEFIRSPQVSVIVQTFVGTFENQIRVLGQAAQPKSVPYRDGMTLLDVMLEVGGLTEFAAGNRARVVRVVDGESKEIRVKLADLLRRGKVKENIPMRPGDIVIIPEAIF